MNTRVQTLREQSVNIAPSISSERAELITAFYASGAADAVSLPVARAMALKYVIEHRTIGINNGELIVGQRGPQPKATPTYPELCCHSLSDLDVVTSRERTPFTVSPEVRTAYAEKIIPFWSGRTLREKVFATMSPQWHDAFDAGVFTEFMEQRAPGHAILDDKIYRQGLLDIKNRIEGHLAEIDPLNDPRAYDKSEELKAMAICIDAVILLANRHADLAEQMATDESDPARKAELEKIADVCRHVPAHAPRTFQEALQSYWFVHLGVITELNTWDSFNPGRLDQHLWPFYQAETGLGTLTRDDAEELLGCFWVKFNNEPAPPKVGVTEEQSGTYQDFALINVGGLTPEGSDAVNEVSHLILDVVQDMQLIQPSACIQLARENPEEFLAHASKVVRTGLGQPSIFNMDLIVQEMLNAGKSISDARAGGPSGCVTVSAFGKESCCLTGYMNWPKLLELAWHDGVDPATGKQIGPQTGDPLDFKTFDDMFKAYETQLNYFVDLKIAGNNFIERLFATAMPAPFMSVVMNDCVDQATDYHNGGARYNPTYIQGVGMGTITDALAALKFHVFDEGNISMGDLIAAMAENFEGSENLRLMLANRSPAYGNDDDYADQIAVRVFDAYYDALNGRPNTKGGQYRVNLLPTTVHIYFGQVTGALPNGRKAGVSLSEGISPTQGSDTRGPTAVMKSAARIDHVRTGGTLLNLKFTPQILAGDGYQHIGNLARAYFELDGHHVQFNVVDAATLRKAQANPQDYKDLIVRVAGYSDYFVDIGSELQEEIISRTEHENF
ncbi:MAG: glycyl radical protein [Phycisphaerales bacterium]|jgi:trans-4-hydroxy-L-proline dehydratase|nr:glycyl radical protein [Phycisphaerales bacterium]